MLEWIHEFQWLYLAGSRATLLYKQASIVYIRWPGYISGHGVSRHDMAIDEASIWKYQESIAMYIIGHVSTQNNLAAT